MYLFVIFLQHWPSSFADHHHSPPNSAAEHHREQFIENGMPINVPETFIIEESKMT